MIPLGESAKGVRLAKTTRWGMVALAIALAGLLGVAKRLEPDPKGFGTHTQLGLPPCHFVFVTGTPCPSCGMTTAYAWFVRGQIKRSFLANPSGAVLAIASMVLIPWLLMGALLAKTPGFRTLEQPLIAIVVTAVTVSLVCWTIRLIFGSHA